MGEGSGTGMPGKVRHRGLLAGAVAFAMLACGNGQIAGQEAVAAPTGALRQGRELLQKKDFAAAKAIFSQYLAAHPGDVQAQLGLGDAELGERQYEAAEWTYRTLVAQQPELWQAHKNLVVVEAALGRWEEFDRERTVLRMARERGAPGISRAESDVIDTLRVGGQTWVVRAYFEPVGRSEAIYNFERFSPDGRVEAYLSLENARAAEAALAPGDVRIGAQGSAPSGEAHGPFALNWYTGKAHGTIRRYDAGQPPYEQVRAEVVRWLRTHTDIGAAPAHP